MSSKGSSKGSSKSKKITITIEIELKPKIRFLKSGRIFKDRTKYTRKKKHKGKEE